MDFYPRPPGGGRHFSSSARSSYSDFYPRPPGGGRQRRPRCLSATKNFYPRPPGGGRPAPKPPLIHTQRFLSTPSGWRATVVLEDHKVVEAGFLSTPSGWRATTPSQMPFSNEKFLSTPSGWRATCPKAPAHPHAAISIHALRVEGDRLTRLQAAQQTLFLSTPSGWRATSSASVSPSPSKFLSTPSGWRATFIRRPTGICFDISIHALRVEGDVP